MPVTLNPPDLIYPVGKLQKSWFNPVTADSLEGVVAEWLDLAAGVIDAGSDALDNAAARHYVYWRAYESIAQRIAGQPMTENHSSGGISNGRTWKLPDQIAYWQGLANAERATFEAVIGGLGGGVTVFTTVPGRRGL